MKIPNAVSSFMCFVIFLTPCRAGEKNVHNQLRPIFIHSWAPLCLLNKNRKLEVKITQKLVDGLTNSTLTVSENNREIYRFARDEYPVSIFTLDACGNLCTIWTTGGPYFKVYVFAYLRDKVSQVLSAATKTYPEFIEAAPSPLSAKAQSILISNFPHGLALRETPRVDIYDWNERNGVYEVKKNIRWDRRFDTH